MSTRKNQGDEVGAKIGARRKTTKKNMGSQDNSTKNKNSIPQFVNLIITGGNGATTSNVSERQTILKDVYNDIST